MIAWADRVKGSEDGCGKDMIRGRRFIYKTGTEHRMKQVLALLGCVSRREWRVFNRSESHGIKEMMSQRVF